MNVKPGRYFAYSGGPIDWWAGWMEPEEAVAASLRETSELLGGDGAFREAAALAADIHRVIELASEFLSRHGWEGDIRGGRRGTWQLAVLPDPDTTGSVLMFSVKQDNNGTTFIVSPYELPWLEGNGTLEGEFRFQR